jgi:putative endonuclease
MAIGREYCVYIMTNAHNTVIYTGVTNDLTRRVYEHRNGLGGIFTKKYNVVKLVYFEVTDNVQLRLREKNKSKAVRVRRSWIWLTALILSGKICMMK